MKVLIIDDEASIRESISNILSDENISSKTAKSLEEAKKILTKEYFPVILLDIWLEDGSGIDFIDTIKELSPNSSIVMITGHGGIELAVQSIKKGAFDFLEKPLSIEKLLNVIEKAHKEHIKNKLTNIEQSDDIIGESSAIKKLKEEIKKVAKSNANIVIFGENGTGKELVAKNIHKLSYRKDKPFVDINCAAIPDELIESELFGYEKGAFTGAVSRKAGKLEIANEGTIFLDEIGDMSLKAQAKLLRAIETKSFHRLGGLQKIDVDVRFICASNKDLKTLIEQGLFREDLYYRLAVITLEVPPLRERGQDVIILAEYFLDKFCQENKTKPKKLTEEAKEVLLEYHWPGNVRELKNLMERLSIIVEKDTIDADSLEIKIKNKESQDFKSAKQEFEKQFILKKLAQYNYNIKQTAQAIGMDFTNLYRKIKAYNIKIEEDSK
ncbi:MULTISPECIES: sigma-54 dependent transcriptional regulator [unclassified Hydrogenobaculum]|uniref:sigma-54-dependent transcriptional regulator n=1 Tax=unclassified Hydrogenobaculum TaxID=2622382 RepID=UPI0001C50DC6|nr:MULTISPECIES: sigma-54 dependent transcriptional regulator [unclassified Hydrogenobaculum]AEF19693.1 two component, sigma54 specific, transcriptional regulator, Fis family [Hydrogenobaculum sp. 3684]AEG46980.1 two component, sigma54 specific, transcriptional regulator, Fis family [Hydrogenobaculum sp. SHO]AGG15628.1 two component, sigma54 specific, transcriptional regulator, Fis family [Hydrogenobaculum sp. HO]AGH93927.1 response regulator with CheY-like receiver, AAA-type ATPase, and DNA-bi